LPPPSATTHPSSWNAAKAYPAVQFRHCAHRSGTRTPIRQNAGSYFSYLNQAHYVDGVAAGLSSTHGQDSASSRQSRSRRCLSNMQLGPARREESVNPNATVQVIFTGEWSMPVREAEAANALIDAGCDVITCHVDGPKVVIETAEGRGVMTCGHNASHCSPLAPKGFITGAE
jgi:basic membrane protein A